MLETALTESKEAMLEKLPAWLVKDNKVQGVGVVEPLIKEVKELLARIKEEE
eukprot:SAG22_NODE_272_length_13192_cov_311.812495_3_plen_52_part_00